MEQIQFNQTLITFDHHFSNFNLSQCHKLMADQYNIQQQKVNNYNSHNILESDQHVQNQFNLMIVTVNLGMLDLFLLNLQSCGQYLESALDIIQQLKEQDYKKNTLIQYELKILVNLCFLCINIENYNQALEIQNEMFDIMD